MVRAYRRPVRPARPAPVRALAAAGRDPTDITLPAAGSQAGGAGPGSGGATVAVASSGTAVAAAGSGGSVQAAGLGEPDTGSHLVLSPYERAVYPALAALEQANNSPARPLTYGLHSDAAVGYRESMKRLENSRRQERGMPTIDDVLSEPEGVVRFNTYMQYSNPFLGVKSSQTHPDDKVLHYGMQVTNVVSLLDSGEKVIVK